MKKTLRPWESYEDDIHVPGNLFTRDLHFQITTRSTPKVKTEEEVKIKTEEDNTILTSLEKAKKILDNH
jgi:hypothetical protein